MKLILNGEPIPKLRPRFMKRGAITFTYDAQEKQKHATQRLISDQIKSLSEKNPIETFQICNSRAFSVDLTFYLPISRSEPQFKRNAKLWGFGFAYHNNRPDVDNLAKFILDCGNGILWSDDAQVVDLNSKKLYSLQPRTEIIIMPKSSPAINEIHKNILMCFKGQKALQDFLLDAQQIGKLALAPEAFTDPEYLENVAKEIAVFCHEHADTIKNIKKRL